MLVADEHVHSPSEKTHADSTERLPCIWTGVKSDTFMAICQIFFTIMLQLFVWGISIFQDKTRHVMNSGANVDFPHYVDSFITPCYVTFARLTPWWSHQSLEECEQNAGTRRDGLRQKEPVLTCVEKYFRASTATACLWMRCNDLYICLHNKLQYGSQINQPVNASHIHFVPCCGHRFPWIRHLRQHGSRPSNSTQHLEPQETRCFWEACQLKLPWKKKTGRKKC